MVVPLAGLDLEHRLPRVDLVDRVSRICAVDRVDRLSVLGALDRIIRQRGVRAVLAGRSLVDVLPLPTGRHDGRVPTPSDVSEPEIPLPGGDVTEGVVRVGATVRRPTGDHSAAVHHVLRHLEEVDFDGAPRLLGIDARGREVLTYVDGEVAGRPWPEWVAEDGRAVSVARLLRRLDDALVPLGVPPDLVFESRGHRAEQPAEYFLGHRDVTPENTVFRGGQAYALIDFDLVRPSTRIDEVCNLLLWWGAWMPVEDREPVMRGIDPAGRGRLLVDSYGLAHDDRHLVVDAAIDTAERSWFSMRDRARTRGGGWARMWADGVGDQIRRREQWLRAHRDALHHALTAGSRAR